MGLSRMNAIEMRQVTVARRGTKILDGVSFELEAGQFLGIIGPNGGGKTTLLRVLLGLVKPDSGDVKVLGGSPIAARGRIGYVPQYARFDSDFPISVLDVVLMGRLRASSGSSLRVLGRITGVDREVALDALRRVQMERYVDRQVGKLSGGQLQRVLIARALAVEPELLLLDEPTASLDTAVGQHVYSLLEELSKTVTIVLVSHDIGVISAHVQVIACLNRKLHYHHAKELSGEILQEVYGCPVELIAHGHAHRVLSHHNHSHDHRCAKGDGGDRGCDSGDDCDDGAEQ